MTRFQTMGRPATLLAAALLAAPALANDMDAAAAKPAQSAPSVRFVEVGEAAGARIVHTTRSFGDRHKAQVLQMFTEGGAAVAVADYDNDGDDDLFVVDSDEGKAHHLLRHDGLDGDGIPQFTDVAKAAGVDGGNDAMSICADALWFDYDNDGWKDLLVARFGTPLLFRNLGPGKDGDVTFEDVSAAVGLTAFGNTIGVIAFDADADGWLDLLLGNYFQPKNLLALETPNVLPNNLDYADNGGGVTFWRNVPLEGGGRGFIDRTKEGGWSHHTGWTLDLGHADLDNDGDQDVYIAGDYGTDRLFINRGDGIFDDVTEDAIGFDTRKGMNVDMGDFNRDGYLDIYVTNITDEYMKECNMLWHNNADGTFIDLSKETGTCDSDWGWAAKFADFDNDGWEDIFTVNGLRSRTDENYIPVLLEVIIDPQTDFSDVNSYPDIGEMTWSGYQKQRYFHNLKDGTFKEMAGPAGVDNDLDGRGIGVGDFDLDGGLDFYQTNANQPTLLYMNSTESPGSWLQMTLEGTKSNRDAIGARVLVTAGGETYLREVNGGNGYASQSTTRLHFGLGRAKSVDRIEIRWPSGATEEIAPAEGETMNVDQILRIKEGKGLSR
ncbi:MAG: CRTAC1 family protein [Acidobacteriota bacterium]